MTNQLQVLDFNDTFLDIGHLKQSFPGYKVDIKDVNVPHERPFK